MTGEAVLSARGLVVRYGAVEAVHGIDLDVARGEVVGLIGPDGAGKTSTLRVLAGLLRSSTAAELAFGSPLWKSRRALHHRLGYLAQRFALYGDLTVDENVQLFARLFGVPDWRARRDDLLARVELSRFRGRRADDLSGGMRQKLALACTLVHSPELLLLDEPTTGVDPVTRRELWRLLGGLVADGLTLVVATPYLDEAERCSRVVLMHEGRVLADAAPATIPGLLPGITVEVSAAPRPAAAAAIERLPGLADLAVFGAVLHARFEQVEEPVAAVRAALASAPVTVEEVRVIQPGLEDAFLYLTRRASGTAREEAA